MGCEEAVEVRSTVIQPPGQDCAVPDRHGRIQQVKTHVFEPQAVELVIRVSLATPRALHLEEPRIGRIWEPDLGLGCVKAL